MIQLRYSYKTQLQFNHAVELHHLLLRCTPRSFDSQYVKEFKLQIDPHARWNAGLDSFGNIVNSVYIPEPHIFLEIESSGVVVLTHYRIEESLNRLYLYPSTFTEPLLNIELLFAKVKMDIDQPIAEKVALLSESMQQHLVYVTGSTTVETTAAQSLELGRGVCQDFAHLLIALCRRGGIAARYVTGFMQGEGFTHAWVEFYDQGFWYAFDPTHNRLIDTGYIKIAHGRDYQDCAIDRGIFKGLSQQKLEVYLKVDMQ